MCESNSRRSGFFVTVAAAMRSIIGSLTPASRRQDHMALPSATAHSSVALSRPSHPAPNVRDDRETPLVWGGTGRASKGDLPVVASDVPATFQHDGQIGRGGVGAVKRVFSCLESVAAYDAATQIPDHVRPARAIACAALGNGTSCAYALPSGSAYRRQEF